MIASFRLIRWALAIPAILVAVVFFIDAWRSWGTETNLTVGTEVVIGLFLLLVAMILRPKARFTKPTRKQLEFAKHLGIDTKGRDRWAVSDAIDQALDQRSSRR